MTSGEPTIRVAGVSKWYASVVALTELSMEVRPGVVGLLGPSGAGKSTLIRILCGQTRPSRGHVQVLGRSPWKNADVMRALG